MWLAFGENHVWMAMMLTLFAMLSAFSCQKVNAWQFDTDPSAILSEGDNCLLRNGNTGTCKLIESCEPYYEGLRKKTIQYKSLVRCSFIGSTEVICCPQSGATTPSTTGASVNWGRTVVIPTTTTASVTRTIRPIVIGDITLTGNEQFFDLSKVLRRTTAKTTRSPLPDRSADQRSFNRLPTNIAWPGQQNQQLQQVPTNSRNVVRFPTNTQGTINPDVEWFNSVNQGSISANMVQLPTQSSTTNSQNTLPIAEYTDPFAPFQFRPGSDDPLLVGASTIRTIADNELGDSLDGEWSWLEASTPSTPTSTTSRTTTTTTSTTSRPSLAVDSILDDWMLAVLDATNSSSIATTDASATVASVSLLSVTPPTTPSSVENRNERPSQAACRRWSTFNPASLTFHILDGVPVGPGEYPHMGGLIYPVGGGADIDVRCGSSLIAERYVLTAAHCVNDPLSLPTMVRFGVVVWNSTDDIQPVDVEIENITLHTDYLSHLRYHDLAIIKLRTNVVFTAFIRPACLYSNMADIDSSIPLVVIGWGVTNVQTRARSEVLLMTNVTTVPLQDCNATHIAYGVSRSYRNGLNEGHYCAFDPELRKDACQSDSGGPLQLVNNKESTIVGIVSFGLSCGSAVPSIYARVAYYLDWIESIVWPS